MAITMTLLSVVRACCFKLKRKTMSRKKLKSRCNATVGINTGCSLVRIANRKSQLGVDIDRPSVMGLAVWILGGFPAHFPPIPNFAMGGRVTLCITARKQTVVHPAPLFYTLILFFKSRGLIATWAPCRIWAAGQ